MIRRADRRDVAARESPPRAAWRFHGPARGDSPTRRATSASVCA